MIMNRFLVNLLLLNFYLYAILPQVEPLQALQLTEVGQVSDSVLLNMQLDQGVKCAEGILIRCFDFVPVQHKFSELCKAIETFKLHNLITCLEESSKVVLLYLILQLLHDMTVS